MNEPNDVVGVVIKLKFVQNDGTISVLSSTNKII